MKHTTTTVIISALLAGSLAAAAPAFARGAGPDGDFGHAGREMSGKPGKRGDHQARIDRLVSELKLDDKQAKKVRAISDKHMADMRGLQARSQDNRKQLRALLAQDKYDAAKLRSLANAQGKEIADRIVMRAQMQAEINKVLTPEQRAQAKQLGRNRGGEAGDQEED